MEKCIKCGNEAKWKSTKYDSPLCTDCAKLVVEQLIKDGKIPEDESSINDVFYPANLNFVPIGF